MHTQYVSVLFLKHYCQVTSQPSMYMHSDIISESCCEDPPICLYDFVGLFMAHVCWWSNKSLPPRRYCVTQPGQSHIATDSQSVSKSWCRTPSGAYDEIFVTFWLLWSCFRRTPFLTRGWACLLYILLAPGSAVFHGSESLGTRNHILLSLSWDFP
jgi:hypothetical protein